MLLVVDIGNTNVVLGIYDGPVLKAHWRLATDAKTTADEYGILFTNLLTSAGLVPAQTSGAIMRLRLSNEGEHGVNGGPAGDLYVAIAVKPHPVFQRKGNDISCDVPISFVTAVLGGKIEVPTLKGTTVMKVPPGTQPDKVLRLKGLGIPSLKHHTTGDQVFTIKVHIPTKLTAKQRELLMEFAKESGMPPHFAKEDRRLRSTPEVDR